MRSCPASFLRVAALVVAAAVLPLAAHSAAVTITVADSAGRPLPDAVVMLEPIGAHAPAKPMAGVQIAQVDRHFVPQVSIVTVGTPVAFPNRDTVRHHVYSFSPVKSFELKLYSGSPHEPVVFDKPGVAVLGCNIHDQMIAWVVVVDTPWYARSGPAGRAQLADVPAGSYRLRAWHAALPEGAEPPAMPITIGAADLEQRVVLNAAGSPP